MGITRIMIRVFLFMFFSIVMLLAGCSHGSSHTADPGALLVIFTSPSGNVSIEQGQSVVFLKEVTGGVSPYTYEWDFGGGANNKLVEDPGQVIFDTPGDYTVKLTVTDSTGISASATITVTVQEKAADTPPGLRYTVPAYGATNVALDTNIQVIFTSNVDLSTVTDSTFKVSIGGTKVPGTITCSDPVATFTPTSGLQPNTLYTATLTSGVKDIAGNDLFASDYVWSFSTIGYTLSAVIVSPNEDVTIQEGQSIAFQSSVSGGTAPYTYKWNFSGDIPKSEEKDPGSITFNARGVYTVILRVTDAYGYTNVAVRKVTVYSTSAGDWTQVSAGIGHTLALKSDYTLWAWGDNTYGQLGNGTHVNRSFPVQISSDVGWTSVCAGAEFSLALRQDGTLWAWGRNNYGQLGDGTNIDRNTPVQVGTDNTWAKVAAGYGHCLAVKNDHTLWAWGLNSSGQLGDSTFIDKNYPIQIGASSNWSLVAAGYGHSLAIKNDRTLWSWGLNNHGQLGDGTYVVSNVPAQMDSENSWVAVAAGYAHNLALRNDASLWAWGDNSYGQLGDGSDDDSNTPVRIGDSDDTWTAVAATHKHSLAIKNDGDLWAWGRNYTGQLGDGTIVDKTTPVQVGPGSTWAVVATGFYHTGAIKTGGTLWTWGYNASGQLGDKTMDMRTTPVQVKW
jgi:alpha-tubulin suppressor-like RCC1 family protein